MTIDDRRQVSTDDEFFQLGLEESPAQFLRFRKEWLSDPCSVRVQKAPGGTGGWDVVLRIDGTYYDKADALEVADQFQREVYGLATQMRRSSVEIVGGYETEGLCPVCGKLSILSRRYGGRYFHSDGSDNDRCWLSILRVEVSP